MSRNRLGRIPGVGGGGSGGDAVTSVNGEIGDVVLDKSDVGLANVDNTADSAKPVSTAQAAAIAAKEGTITAGTTSQYWRGDKTWQTLDKTAVGLANVDNTADTGKPVSTAQQTALNAKEGTITAGTTSQYWRGDKTWQTLDKASVGLSNVDNTSDLNKPVSTATTAAINAARAAYALSGTSGGTVTLTYDGAAVNTGTPNVYLLGTNRSVLFELHIIGRQSGTDTVLAAIYRGAVSRAAGSGRFVSSVQWDAFSDSAADTAADVSISIDTTSHYLKIQGVAASGTWVWSAKLLVSEVAV